VILLEKKKKLTKTSFAVLLLGFFIVLPCFVSAQALESETEEDTIKEEEMIVGTLQGQVQELQTRLDEVKLKILDIIEQRVLEIKEKVVIVAQEVQEKVELAETAKAEALSEEVIPEELLEPEEEEVAEEEVAEELFEEEVAEEEEEIVQATTQATSTEALITEEATSTEAIEETQGEEATDQVVAGSTTSPTTTPTPTPADTTAPISITNLSISNVTASSIDLSWISPGDDGGSGTATSYDIRYSTAIITSANWDSASAAIAVPTPLLAGSTQSMTIPSLSSGTTYYFAIKASDEASNESNISNVVSRATDASEQCSTSVASGQQTYFVRTQNIPQIMQIDINPLDVAFGVTQVVAAKIRDTNDNPITVVNGTVQLDNSSETFTLSLISGSDTNGTWEGFWSPNDTLCTTYFLTISATSASGQSSVDLAFR
jgi:hypothetical protein